MCDGEGARTGGGTGQDRSARDGSNFWRGTVACTGSEFCKLAITETKAYALGVGEMEDRLPEFDQQLKLHVTGCPNGCGQHWMPTLAWKARR